MGPPPPRLRPKFRACTLCTQCRSSRSCSCRLPEILIHYACVYYPHLLYYIPTPAARSREARFFSVAPALPAAGAHEEERHGLGVVAASGLEKYGLAVVALRALHRVCAGQRRVCHDVGEHERPLRRGVVHFVAEDHVVLCQLLVVAVVALEEQAPVRGVLLGVQDVVAATRRAPSSAPLPQEPPGPGAGRAGTERPPKGGRAPRAR